MIQGQPTSDFFGLFKSGVATSLNAHKQIAGSISGLSQLNSGDEILRSVFIFSTYIMSLWLWLFLAAFGAGRLIVHSAGARTALLDHFHLKEKPLTFLGALSVLVFSLVFWIVVAI